MKNILFFCAFALVLASCNTINNTDDLTPIHPNPSNSRRVVFHVNAFRTSTEPMSAPIHHRIIILDDQDGTPLTDLYIFDGTTQVAHQTSDAANFGEVILTMTYGLHNLSFVATRSLGQSYADGILSVTSLRPTFGKLQAVTISDSSDAFEIELNRINGQLIITLEDAIPADTDHITFNVATKYDNLNVTTLGGVNSYAFEQSASLTSSVGVSGKSYTINMLTPTYNTQYTTDVTLSVYRSDNSLVSQHVINDVPICNNTKTMLSGEMFGGQSFSISVNQTWADPINAVW